MSDINLGGILDQMKNETTVARWYHSLFFITAPVVVVLASVMFLLCKISTLLMFGLGRMRIDYKRVPIVSKKLKKKLDGTNFSELFEEFKDKGYKKEKKGPDVDKFKEFLDVENWAGK